MWSSPSVAAHRRSQSDAHSRRLGSLALCLLAAFVLSSTGVLLSPIVAGAQEPTLPPSPSPVGEALVAEPEETGVEQPNIVVFLLDDLPGDITPRLLERLPNMNELFAENGLRFEHFYNQDPLCSPSRANLLTGLNSSHHGVRENWAPALDPGETIATALDEVGYQTMYVGKYLNNSERLKDPTPPGWDRVAMYGQGAYYDYEIISDGKSRRYGSRPSHYSTDVLAGKARRLLREAPPEDPVFLYWSPSSVHNTVRNGVQVPPPPAPRHAGAKACKGMGYRKTRAYNERNVSDKPAWIQRLDYTLDPFYSPRGYALRPVCEALLSVDDAVGDIVEQLKRQGRYENTIFVLTADNGMGWGDHRRRAKSVPWSAHVPFYVSWAAELGEERGRIKTWAQNTDLAPTLAEAAGATLGPYPTGQDEPDGSSLLEVIRSRGEETLPRTALFEEHRDAKGPLRWRGLRTTDQHPQGLWHYTEWASGARELYDLENDPRRLKNLARKKPKLARAFHRELRELAKG